MSRTKRDVERAAARFTDRGDPDGNAWGRMYGRLWHTRRRNGSPLHYGCMHCWKEVHDGSGLDSCRRAHRRLRHATRLSIRSGDYDNVPTGISIPYE